MLITSSCHKIYVDEVTYRQSVLICAMSWWISRTDIKIAQQRLYLAKQHKKGINFLLTLNLSLILISLCIGFHRLTVSLMTNSFSTRPCFARVIRTGDVGFICPTSGYLYIIGRVDDMVKVNGVKICVGNIDQLLARLQCEGGVFAGLGLTLTIPIEKGETSMRLVCFYQRETIGNNGFTNADLAEVVRTHFSAFLNVTFVEVSSI